MEVVSSPAAAAARPLTLLDLPDDALSLVTRHLFQQVPHGHVPLFLTCKRLRDVGYASIRSVFFHCRISDKDTVVALHDEDALSTTLSVPKLLLDTAEGAALQALLRSTLGFLSHVHWVRDVTIHDGTRNGDRSVPVLQRTGLAFIFYAMVLPEVRRLPLSSLSVSWVAVKLLKGPPMSTAPLRRLTLDQIEDEPAWNDAVRSVLGHHGHTLRELDLSGVVRDAQDTSAAYNVGPWLAASGGMPNLNSLRLHRLDVEELAAMAVATYCPALTKLTFDAQVYPYVGAALRYPAALPLLADVTWETESDATAATAELVPLLVGRSLAKLRLPTMYGGDEPPNPHLVPALAGAAALPADLSLMFCGALDDAHLSDLFEGAPATASVSALTLTLHRSVTAAGLRRLGGLPALTRLKVLCPPVAGGTDLRLDAWPVGAPLTDLTVYGLGRPAAGRTVVDLLRGLSRSSARHSLQQLETGGQELTETDAAGLLAALPRLRVLHYEVRDETGQALRFHDADESLAAGRRMAAWLRRRLPHVALPFHFTRSADAVASP